MSYDNANKVVHELFDPLLLRYQIGLEISMRGRAFIFDVCIINVIRYILNVGGHILILQTG